jgi:diketogulonate reductase-like aldo/keto reductase
MPRETKSGSPSVTSSTPHPTRRAFVARLTALGALIAGPSRLLAGGSAAAQQTLPTRPIPTTGERLPVVGYGSSAAVIEIPEAGLAPVASVMRRFVELGGRVVDTSVRTEEIDAVFGRLLQDPDIRDRVFLATKINTPDAATGIAQMRQTQRLFARRTVDLIQVESLRGIEHHWSRLQEWKASGETRYIGVTVAENFNHERLEAFMRAERPDFVHVNYSLLERNAEERLLPLAADRGFAVLINRPFMNGSYFSRVAGRALPSWAADFDCRTWAQFSLKYILAHPAVTCVLTETTNPSHIAENVEAGLGRLPDEATRRRMREVAATI